MTETKPIIAIVGAGLMGHGIAQVFACAGHPVRVYDAMQPALDSLQERIANNLQQMDIPLGPEKRVSGHADMAEAMQGAKFVFEAAPERLELKQEIFAQLEEHADADAILASNTSVIPITDISAKAKTKHRILGTHWWNPPFLIPLVEVVPNEETTPQNMDAMSALLADAGKTPVQLKRDAPGFIGNRLQHALWREAIHIVAEGIADAKAVDDVVKSSFGKRLEVLGPLENADLVGTELTLDIHNVILKHLNASPDASPYLQKLIDDGRLGMKSGEGFQSWTDEEADALRARLIAHLNKK